MNAAFITMNSLRAQRADIERVADRWGARNIRVFGSVARGDTRAPGDVDFLVEFAPDRSLLDHGGFVNDLESLLGVPVDVVSEKGLRPGFRQRVMQEAQPL